MKAEKIKCPKCNNTKLSLNGILKITKVGDIKEFKCSKCNNIFLE